MEHLTSYNPWAMGLMATKRWRDARRLAWSDLNKSPQCVDKLQQSPGPASVQVARRYPGK